MGLRRTGLIALVLAALGVMSTACQPAPEPVPQMKLTLDVDPAGTYEILTGVATANVRLSRTRPYSVKVTVERPLVWGAVQDLGSQRVDCPGPAGGTLPIRFELGYVPTSEPVPIRMEATTSNPLTYPGPPFSVERTPAIDLASTSDGAQITFRHILCWPGAPACSSA
jgi:hypothetical protein